jgi:hypothetical protein
MQPIRDECGVAVPPTEDDVAGLRALYDPWIDFTCLPAANDAGMIGGTVPFDVHCVTGGDRPTSATWRFGDGGVSSELAGAHTYDTAGIYGISVSAEGVCDGATWTAAGEDTITVQACCLAPSSDEPTDEGCGCANAHYKATALALLALLGARRRRH